MERFDGAIPGPGPFVHPENAPFWNAIAAGDLVLQRCIECGTLRFPVAPFCFACLSPRTELAAIDPVGATSSVIEIDRAVGDQQWSVAVPFLTGLVDMSVGVRLPGRIFCVCGEARHHGTPVTAVGVPTIDAGAIYAFVHDCCEPITT
jgi:uncharacterized OB-fold protein